MRTRLRLLFLCALVLSGCNSLASVNAGLLPEGTVAVATQTLRLPSDTPRPTGAPARTVTPTPTGTATPGPTATWAQHTDSDVIAPILLYHHISDGDLNNRYFVSPAIFEKQMQTLRDLGYTSLPISILVETIRHGGLFPERPVVITFDDGNEDIYSTAFPIMRRYGFVGTFYMVANRLGAKDFVNADQLIEMAAAGWEIGSHGYSHVDLTTDHSLIFHEMADSRRVLQEKLHVPVNTIAYPFGNVDATVLAKAEKYGYKAGLGLGTYREHTFGALYYLSRMEVRSDYDMAAFMALLPWTDKLK